MLIFEKIETLNVILSRYLPGEVPSWTWPGVPPPTHPRMFPQILRALQTNE